MWRLAPSWDAPLEFAFAACLHASTCVRVYIFAKPSFPSPETGKILSTVGLQATLDDDSDDDDDDDDGTDGWYRPYAAK